MYVRGGEDTKRIIKRTTSYLLGFYATAVAALDKSLRETFISQQALRCDFTGFISAETGSATNRSMERMRIGELHSTCPLVKVGERFVSQVSRNNGIVDYALVTLISASNLIKER